MTLSNFPKHILMRACKGFSVYGIWVLFLFCLWHTDQYIFFVYSIWGSLLQQIKFSKAFTLENLEEKYFLFMAYRQIYFLVYGTCIWRSPLTGPLWSCLFIVFRSSPLARNFDESPGTIAAIYSPKKQAVQIQKIVKRNKPYKYINWMKTNSVDM